MKRSALVFSVCFFLEVVMAWAAITGSISGIISDPTGAVMPSVTVVATETSTNLRFTAVTDASGFYAFPTLNVGHYDVTVSKDGFRDFLERGVTIDVNSNVRLDAKMQMGATSNTITVSSDAQQVETQSTQMGDVIESEQIAAAPLDGRSYISLLELQPGVSPYDKSVVKYYSASQLGPGSVDSNLSNGSQSVNGGRMSSNGFMMNGADAEETIGMGAAIVPNLDSIAEFRIITNNFNAEYGNFSGGQINVVTKSGANRMHGDAFDFLRNTDLDAKNYFSTQVSPYKQNQFGGTVGGPIRKDKIFWFGDYQGTKQNIAQATNLPVPSVADRSGNLSDQASALELSAPANAGFGVQGAYFANLLSQELGYPVTSGEPYYTAGCTVSANCVFPNAQIPQSAISPIAQALMKYIPSPNVPGQDAYESTAYPETLTDNKGGIRLDANTRYGAAFAYYFADKYSNVNPYSTDNVPGFADANTGLSQLVDLGLTKTLNSSNVNDIRVVYMRDTNLSGVPESGTGVTLASLGFNTPWGPTGGIGAVDPSTQGIPSMGFNNYTFGVSTGALRLFNNTLQVIDNFTRVVGAHTLQFGGDFHYDQVNERNIFDQNGAFSFGGQETGFDFADYLIGASDGFTQASVQYLNSRSKYYGFFAQDSWRVRPTLTFNYGLRWEASTPWYDTRNLIGTAIQGEQSKVFPNAPVGLVFPGDPGVPQTLAPTKYTSFAPRIGLAYSPNAQGGLLGKLLGGPGKSSIRAGYGIFYSSIADASNIVEGGDAPFGIYYTSPEPDLLASPYVTRSNGAVVPNYFPFVMPAAASPQHPNATFPWSLNVPIGGSIFYSPHNQVPMTHEYELSLERQLGSSTVMDVSYVGTIGRHLLTDKEINPGDAALCLYLSNPANLAPGQQPCGPNGENNVYTEANGTVVNGTRPNFGIDFTSDAFLITEAGSSYNSLQASLKNNQKYGNFLIAYTYEKSMDNSSGELDSTNPFNPRLSRALSTFDVPQNLTASYTANLLFNNFLGNGNIAKRFTAGWQVSGISSFVAGVPVIFFEHDDRSLVGSNTIDYPNYANNGSPLFVNKNPRSGQPYFNPNYFAKENLGQVGDMMRRFFVGPGRLNSDLALLKNTQITETTRLQFRAEAFNAFNHAQFNNPKANILSSGSFGYVTTAADPRIMQVALKLLF